MNSNTILIFLSILFSASISQAQSVSSVLNGMYDKIDKHSKWSFQLKSKERFKDKYVEKKLMFHIYESSSKKVYMKDLNKGLEVLFVKGWNDNKAHINTNGFPWVNVNLSIYNAKMYEDSHRRINEAGFSSSKKMLQRISGIEKHASLDADASWGSTACYKITIKAPEYEWKTITLSKDEHLKDLCYRLKIPEYTVMERNKIGHGKIKAGKQLTVPNFYAKKVIFFIDKKTNLPVAQQIYDDKGLYEQYQYSKVETAPKFSSDEWTVDCEDYGF